MKKTSTALAAAFLALAAAPVFAAQVDLTQNSVSAGRSTLKPGATVAPGSTISTGSKSRTQISLGSKGSVVRAGSKTQAVLENDSNLTLRQGVMLASSGRSGLGRDAVNVKTPETNVTAKGTMLVAYQPDVFLKVTCIEGSVTVKLKALVGEFVTLTAGQMVIINPAEKRLPQEVEVDLKELTATSALLGGSFPSLASAPRLERAAGRQERAIGEGDAVRTPLVLDGAGLEVTLRNESGVNGRFDPAQPAADTPPPRVVVRERIREAGPEYIINGQTVFGHESGEGVTAPTLQTPGFGRKVGQTGPITQSGATVWTFPDANRDRNPELLVIGNVQLPSTSPDGDAYVTPGGITVGGVSATVRNQGDLHLHGGKSVDIKRGTTIGSGDNTFASLTLISGGGVSVTDSVLQQSGGVDVVAPNVRVNGSRIEAGDGIIIDSTAKSGAEGSIVIANSSQLHSMATSFGIEIISSGAPILIDDSMLDATEILLQSGSPSSDGFIGLRNVTMNAEVIGARAFGSGDRDALHISGGQFNAGSLVKFYAEGASKLRFTGDVNINLSNLSSGRAVLAGRVVQVDAGGRVRVNGNTEVYRDVDNYNKAGYGNIQTSGSHSDLPYGQRPTF